MQAFMRQPEAETDAALPRTLFSAENLRLHLNGAVLSTLQNLGLRCNQRTPDFKANLRLSWRSLCVLD